MKQPSETTPDTGGPTLRWGITLVLVMVLVYPLAIWIRETALVRNTGITLSEAETHLQRSVEEYQAGRFEEAIAAARLALATNSTLAEAYNNIAVSYLKLERYDEGIEAALKALELQPEFELARNNLAWLEEAKANSEQGALAAQWMQEGMDLLYTGGDGLAAAERFRQVLDINPDHYGANYQLAAALEQAGHPELAYEQWLKALGMAQEIGDSETEALIEQHLALYPSAEDPKN